MTYPKASAVRISGVGTSGAGPAVEANPRLPDIEERTQRYWDDDHTFEASVEARSADSPDGTRGGNEFVFYDGPPFANGLPHYGHLLTGYVKDVVPRYQTMRGRRVERRFGWDCHGLPAEVEAEKQLGISHKAEIEQMGIATFNDACRSSVLAYTKDWEDYVHRQARWVDFVNDYKTLDLDYMESVMWAFKALWDSGLVYEGFRVLAYCWRCETPLSNTETRMDDVYRQRQDPAVTVSLPLTSGPAAGAEALIWTTTPWTLPSNLAMAVHPDLDYAVVEPEATSPMAGRRVLLATTRIGHFARELGDARVVVTLTGADLVGSSYTPPFGYFAGRRNAHQVLPADYVSTDEGTGIVHIAPAFGEEDKVTTDAADIDPVIPVDGQGRFTVEVSDYAGMQVFDANPQIVADLKTAGSLIRHETYEHPYPHCWRCDNPLIYRAVSSWFVKVTAFRDRMVELNQQIHWVPEHIRDGSFGKWLENARDWSISRSRYWGSPIPVWVSDDPAYPRIDVYGSRAELERDFGVVVTDLHRPMIDELTRPNPDDPRPAGQRSTMRRVPEVLDCWFESGSMPFAQVHYPFENTEWFENHYPGDFIVEYIGQTRGWFYTMHVLATALFDRPAFSTCVSHGILLGDDGRKMSKSLRNYPDVRAVFDRDGSDAMRWFLMSSPVLRGGNLMVTDRGIRDGVRQVLLPLWNVWYFFALYANTCGQTGYEASWRADSADVLDRYLLAKTADLAATMTAQMDAYDIAGACQSLRDHLDVLTNWYVRRSRERFWATGGATADTRDAFDTLYTALEVLTRLAAPLLPLVTEEIWRGLTGGRSVHLSDWPVDAEDSCPLPTDADLVAAMDSARAVASAALGLRKAAGLRVRLPLPKLTVVSPDPAALQRFTALVADEVNVAEVALVHLDAAAEHEVGISRRLTVNARAAGPRLGREVQDVIRASKSGDWQESDGAVVCGGVALLEGEYTVETVVADAAGTSSAVAVLTDGGFVVLDTTVTPQAEAEGLARDLIRQVQAERRAADLAVGDRILLRLASADAAVVDAVRTHEGLIRSETLAEELTVTGVEEPSTVGTWTELPGGLQVGVLVEALVVRAR